MPSECKLYLSGEQATLDFGAHIARALQPGTKIYLHGDLGAGKTTLVRGVLRALGVSERVKSPTYTLVELYKLSKLDLYHFDFYRFNDPNEWVEAGLRDMFAGEAVVLVEWPERAQDLLPRADIEIALSVQDAGRRAHVCAQSEAGERVVRALNA
jgi:tRNA threonylcarbamoyladenosine biosynthesis protein TsaE